MKIGLKALLVALILSWLPTVGFAMRPGASFAPSPVAQNDGSNHRKKRPANRRSCRGGKQKQEKRKRAIDDVLDRKSLQEWINVVGELACEQLKKYVDSLEAVALPDGNIGNEPSGTLMHALIWRGSTEQLEAFVDMPSFKSNAAYWLETTDIYGYGPQDYAAHWPKKVAILEAACDRVCPPVFGRFAQKKSTAIQAELCAYLG